MARIQYSIRVVGELRDRIRAAALHSPFRPGRYEDGDVLNVTFTTVWPEVEGRGRFRVDRFVGGGFAGQVYRCVIEEIDVDRPGLQAGSKVALKILVPPTRFSRLFRNALYWVGFQAPFSAQVSMEACRAGLIWQKLARLAAGIEFGDKDAVADVYASFHDPALGAWGEIREWVEGRTWVLEPDLHPRKRRAWRTVDPLETDSPEYIAKRQFMYRFVQLLHRMGARELARQYEWWTMKSQPNVLKRMGCGPHPAAGLCAVDFRAGLVLLPFLPMSPRDIGLIGEGLLHGSLVQFDRPDLGRLRDFAANEGASQPEFAALASRVADYERVYRRSMPDVFHQGHRLLLDRSLRFDVRRGVARGLACTGLIDEAFAERLAQQPGRYLLFMSLSVIPFAGRFLRRLWGSRAFAAHVRDWCGDGEYRRRAIRAGVCAGVIGWVRAGRCSEARALCLVERPSMFWIERCTLGLLPRLLHRITAEPGYVKERLGAAWRFVRSFYRDPAFREQWLTNQVEDGYRSGMLTDLERDRIMAHVRDPFIVKYLKCMGVHFATLPITQLVSVLVGAIVAVWVYAVRHNAMEATGAFFGTLLFFQFIPVSPGSFCRGLFTMCLVIRERDFRDYMVAAPLSFVKYIGYLAFPIQMVATYPELSRFMAGRWATGFIHIVPVFGETGALLEHMIFDLFFNRARIVGRQAREHARWLLSGWMLLGAAAWFAALGFTGATWTAKAWINSLLALVTIFVLPRVLFYPLLTRRPARTDPV